MSAKIVAAAPFIAAALFYLIAPELTRLVKQRVDGLLAAARTMASATKVDAASTTAPAATVEVPPHLSPEYIGDYIEYAVDAATVFPTLVLPIIGAVFALTTGMTNLGVGLLLGLGIPSVIFIGLRTILADPIRYASKHYLRGRYTFLAVAGLVLNLVAGVIVAVFLRS